MTTKGRNMNAPSRPRTPQRVIQSMPGFIGTPKQPRARSSLQAIGSCGNVAAVILGLTLALGTGCSLMYGPEMNLSATVGADGCRYVESAGRAWSSRGVEFRSGARDPSELYFT